MLLDRDDWYDIAHDLDWSLSYVAHDDAFPETWTVSIDIRLEPRLASGEPFRLSSHDYLNVH